MNCMNNIVIEGNIATSSCRKSENTVIFDLATYRVYKSKDGSKTTDTYTFKVESEYIRNMEIGRGCRVVGRLAQDKQSKEVYIVAELLELKKK